jgi:prepilin-type N-terminal cleavage/methylation domain-containing protein
MKKAITLIEILIVIAIIAIGLGLSSNMLSGWMTKYRLKTDINKIDNFLKESIAKASQTRQTITLTNRDITDIMDYSDNLTITLNRDIEFYPNATSSGSILTIDSSTDDYRFEIFSGTSFIHKQIDKGGSGVWQDL